MMGSGLRFRQAAQSFAVSRCVFAGKIGVLKLAVKFSAALGQASD